MNTATSEKGFAPLFILLGVAVLIAVLTGGTYLLTRPQVKPLTSIPTPTPSTLSHTASTSGLLAPDSCSKECQALIDKKLDEFKKDLIKTVQEQGLTTASRVQIVNPPQSASTPAAAIVSPTNQPKEINIHFGTNGYTTANSWVDVAGSQIKFDPANYPGAKAFYFQATLESDLPDRPTTARIFDATHSVGVQGSDITYTGLTPTVKDSTPLQFLSGAMTLQVQIHNLDINKASIYNPKIKVVY